MSDILARYGPHFLYTYTVVMGLGLAAALGLSAVLARRVAATGWIDGALAAAAGALLGGRVVFVRLNAAYFAENPAETWQLWLGGLNVHGALLGGLVGLALWARLTRRPLAAYAGLFAPGLALLAAAGWAACHFEGCAYGRPPDPDLPRALNFLTGHLPDDLGVFAARYRTQPAGMVGSLAVLALSLAAFGRVRPGLLFWGALGGLSLVRVVVAFGRGDATPPAAGWRLDLLIDAGLVAVSLAAGFVPVITGRRMVRG